MKKNYLIISFIGLLLGLMLAVQYQLIEENYLGGMLPATKLNQMKTQLDNLHEEKKTLILKVNKLQDKLDSIISAEADENLAMGTLNEELNKYKMLAGFTSLQGQGVAIYLDNAPMKENSEGVDIVQDYNLILFIVNELNASGAEAISINDQRFISGTEIRGISDYISINEVSLKPPFIIKAIGDKEVLSTALEQRFGVVEVVRNRGYFCQVNKINELRVVGANKVFDWKYAKPKTENDF